MRDLSRITLFLALPLLVLCTAQGQATRTWVSGVGDDANPCSRTAPCKTFAGAISKTAAGGEIDALDPGGFGGVTITKAITIDGGGGQIASILVLGTPGVTVNAGSNDVVTLRNLSINGINQSTSAGTNGVNILAARAVHIENCAIVSFLNAGVLATPQAGTELYIDHSFIRDNTVSGITAGSGTTTSTIATVSNTTLENNGVGLLASGNSKVTVMSSVASGNTNAGFQADASAGPASINVLSSVSANNGGAGLQASSTGSSAAVIRISGDSVFSNRAGLTVGTNGNVFSYGDNQLTGTGTPTATLSKQ